MWFRHLTASAACATLLGLAAAGLVRRHASEIVSAMTTTVPRSSQSDEKARSDGDVPPAVEPEPEPQSTTPEMLSTASPLFEATERRRGRLARAARSASPRSPARYAFSQELNRGIRKLGKRRYEIKRGALDLALRNLPSLSASVRVAPEMRDGKPFGFRLFAIRADGPVAKLGLRNEDILVSVNGLDITTPDHVLNAYDKLKAARRLALRLVREERALVQEYSVR
ncbi:MAG: hypothetical protein JXP73_22320 [Deltaproteobacteria bacterium]|nr:hypothetical protein [Deltaproteobacteria bacterium]